MRSLGKEYEPYTIALMRVGVVVPVFNGMPFLPRTLTSISRQTSIPDEVIISNNASTDSTQEYVQDFVSRSDMNILAVDTPRLLNVAESWNFAISNSTCEWFYLLHSDDVLHRKAIQELKKVIAKAPSNTVLVSFRSENIDERGRLVRGKIGVGKPKSESGLTFLKQNISSNSISSGCVAINRSAWLATGGYNISSPYWLDLLMYHQLCFQGEILKSPKVRGRYRVYSYVRTENDRQTMATANEIFYFNEYLPELFRKYQGLQETYEDQKIKRNKMKSKIKSAVRQSVLSATTVYRRILMTLHVDGFPE
jgi:glycosyltransferase involved in cell wall biosynthesis